MAINAIEFCNHRILSLPRYAENKAQVIGATGAGHAIEFSICEFHQWTCGMRTIFSIEIYQLPEVWAIKFNTDPNTIATSATVTCHTIQPVVWREYKISGWIGAAGRPVKVQ